MTHDSVPLKGHHHVELWVGNAKQAAYFYRKALGFSQIAFSGLETGNREYASYVLQQGNMHLILSTPYQSTHPMNDHLRDHGDGVKDIAFEVDDADAIFKEVVARGATPDLKPHTLSDENGTIRKASIKMYGDTTHTFISRNDYKGPFLPGFREEIIKEKSVGLHTIDHMVANVEDGKMDEWVAFYKKVLGFNLLLTFSDDQISTEYTALMSKVMQNGTGKIKFPINEPAKSKRKSQIEEYLDYYGPGIQHIAMETDDIVETISKLRANGVEFLDVPHTYYDMLTERVGAIEEDLEDIRRLNILVDRDDDGYLLQLFTQPIEDRPTLFIEIIQRKGCQGFGLGNFKALFESIERVQAERGNL
ncbi:MAG: 4-hydroxyphenylpyruvate dioxygenase [Waddliaceae bacterium]|nr:4-hydroxyphenylpyruvate dioxygenase [Waddliaceae bacterium]